MVKKLLKTNVNIKRMTHAERDTKIFDTVYPHKFLNLNISGLSRSCDQSQNNKK